MMNNFEKELEKIVEDRVNKLVSKSDARDISEFARDAAVVSRLDRTYDSKDLLMLLHDAFEDDCELEERVDKYGLKTIFSNVYDVEHGIIEAFNSGRDEWFSEVIDALDHYLPVY